VFSECGYGAATFQAIAIRADLTRPAINHYFANKRVLYWQVLEETTETVIAASAERARREATLVARVIAFLEGTIEAEVKHRTAAAFLITATLEAQRHPELRRPQADPVGATREFLIWAVKEGIDRGELQPDTDAGALAAILHSVLLGVGFYAGYVGTRNAFDNITGQLRQLLASGLNHQHKSVQ
jgi:TetR/AcrR family transcriptional repressor of uid operon